MSGGPNYSIPSRRDACTETCDRKCAVHLAAEEAADLTNEAGERSSRDGDDWEGKEDSLGLEYERTKGYANGKDQPIDPKLLEGMQGPVVASKGRPMDQKCLGECTPKCTKR